MTYFVIGLCIFLLLAVIYFSIKPISMGIEARRNIKDETLNDNPNNSDPVNNQEFIEEKTNSTIADEIIKLNKLKNEGLLTQEEFEKAKDKLLT